MARIRAGDVTLGYDVLGPDGAERVILLNGLGGPKEGWRFQVSTLEERFQVLLIDNRGVGESDKPDHPYSIQMFAHDAANLMAVLGWEQAHLIGQSMGGMIAQEFALAFPFKTKSVCDPLFYSRRKRCNSTPRRGLGALVKKRVDVAGRVRAAVGRARVLRRLPP